MVEFVRWLDRLPDLLIYVVLALGAGVENFVPAVPADTFVALGGFLAGAGNIEAHWVALSTWVCNVAGALFVYRMSALHGPRFFRHGLGRHIIRPHQMERIQRFYDRWGPPAIFVSRFVPGVRAIVPVFAGVSHMGWKRVAIPIAAASAIWYVGLVMAGLFVGRNLEALDEILSHVNRTLAGIGLVIALALVIWWVRSRREPDDD